MKKVLFLSILCFALLGCENKYDKYGFLRVINDRDYDEFAQAEHIQVKGLIYEMWFPAHSDVVYKMREGNYSILWVTNVCQIEGLTRIAPNDTFLIHDAPLNNQLIIK